MLHIYQTQKCSSSAARGSTSQCGFTLVELAVSIMIIGLLAGAVIKGRELVINSRATGTVMQAQTISGAVTGFRKMYGSYPGDFPNANTRLSRCNANCNAVATYANDGFVGDQGWPFGTPQIPPAGMNNPPSTARDESQLFWIHLLKSDFYTGTKENAINGVVAPRAGVTNPLTPFGATFLAASGWPSMSLTGVPGSYFPAGRAPSGLALALVGAGSMYYGANIATQGAQAVPGPSAMLIDKKMDDGLPNTGRVLGYGSNGAGSDNCYKQTAGIWVYDEDDQRNDCNMLIIIDGQGI